MTKETGSDEHAARHTRRISIRTEHMKFCSISFEHRLEMTHRMDENGIQITLNIINEGNKPPLLHLVSIHIFTENLVTENR